MRTFKNVLTVVLTIGIMVPTLAQKLPREVFYKAEPFENEYVKVEILNPHSQETFTQFTIKVWNKSDDYILLKKHLIMMSSDEGDYNTKHQAQEKTVFVEPKGDITRYVKVLAGSGCRVNNITLSFKDAFFRVPVDGKKSEGGEFLMPPDVKSKMIEPFSVSLRRWSYSPKQLTADFKIKYRGEGIGIVDERAVKVRTEDGTILENKLDDRKPQVLPPLVATTVTISRSFEKGQLKKNQPLYVVWDDVFQTAVGEPFEVSDILLTNPKQ